jgi:hypothetical protein
MARTDRAHPAPNGWTPPETLSAFCDALGDTMDELARTRAALGRARGELRAARAKLKLVWGVVEVVAKFTSQRLREHEAERDQAADLLRRALGTIGRRAAVPAAVEALTLTTPDRRILDGLRRFVPRTAHQVDLEAADCGSRGFVGRRLRALEGRGLVNRPHGARGGWALTAAGRRLLGPPGARN